MFDFSDLRMGVLTDVHGGLHVLAIGWSFWDIWRAKTLGFMIVIRIEAAQKRVITKYIE